MRIRDGGLYQDSMEALVKICAPLAMPVKLHSADQEQLRFHINYGTSP